MPENTAESKRFELHRASRIGLLARMSSGQTLLRAWLPPLLWMLAIYIGSTDALSSQHTSRFLGPFLRWLIPGISDAAIHGAQYVIRKIGHLTEYAVLALLFHRALRMAWSWRPGWNWRAAGIAFVLAAAYAVTDEFHQGFVATRYGSPFDVVIDATGAALGLGALWLWEIAKHTARRRAPSTREANQNSELLPG